MMSIVFARQSVCVSRAGAIDFVFVERASLNQNRVLPSSFLRWFMNSKTTLR